MNPAVKYYGGKYFMRDIIKGYFPESYTTYVEGFGGSASVLLSIPITGTVVEVYNDLGQDIYSLYKVVSDTDTFKRLKQRMDLTPYSYQLWKEYSESLKTNPNLDIEERAYMYLYVNRTSFNGVGSFSVQSHLIRRGMSKSTSDYLAAIERLPEIHDRLSGVIIENRDINKIIEKYDSETTFFYLDPPYVKETRRSGQAYAVEMSNDDHTQMLNRILQSKGMFLISGYDHPLYDVLTDNGYRKETFQSPNSGSSATETLWFNYNPVGKKTQETEKPSLGKFFG